MAGDPGAASGQRGAFREVADRVWVARHDWFDVNVTVIAGSDAAVLVDTHGSGAAARDVLTQLAGVGGLPRIRAIVNTHEHFDHTFGNAEVRAACGAVPIHAHRVAAERTRAAGERTKATYSEAHDDPRRDEVLATTIVPADHPFTAQTALDLGDRSVTLSHPGRGHTAGDLVVHVPDADTLLAGDLVEESAPPVLGFDSHPLDWPATLQVVANLLADDTVVVPGHGAVVDRGFVLAQAAELREVARTIHALVAAEVPLADALASATWPWPKDALTHAVSRGYEQLAG